MQKYKTPFVVSLVVLAGVPFIITHPALAADSSIVQVESFIKSIIKVISGLAGLIAAGFFVAGGFGYITSTGDPERLERAKHTLIYSALGLAIVIAAFVISNIVTDLASSAFGS